MVLPGVAPEVLLEQGLEAWALLPLVGSEERVIEDGADWYLALRERARATGDTKVLELFLRFLSARLRDSLDVTEVLGEDVMEDTLTGKRLIAKGILEVVELQLHDRLGELATSYRARLKAAPATQLKDLAHLLADRSLDDEGLVAGLEQILDAD